MKIQLGGAQTDKLPDLRKDIALLKGPRAQDGSSTWTLHDQAANRFFRIGWREFEILLRWELGDVASIIKEVNEKTPLKIEQKDVEDLAEFLKQNNLIAVRTLEDRQMLLEKSKASSEWNMHRIFNSYFFTKIPLINPDGFLDKTLPIVKPLFSIKMLYIVLFAAFSGLILLMRQWDEFSQTFLYFFNAQGAVIFVLTMIFSQVFHEFGHAYTSKYYGTRVPSMGIAFFMLFPLLYTDTSDAWRLNTKRKRILIGSAGMVVELTLAAISTWLWLFLDEGTLRSAAFMLCTVTWVATLAINLNPFMRFDGYYLLADISDTENLQPRAFALAKWWIRERIFGFNSPPPEALKASKHTFMITYAFATWIYRLILYFGLALIVYKFFFKALGITMFVAEIYFLILTPIFKELAHWWQLRPNIKLNLNLYFSAIIFAIIIGFFVVPWHSGIKAPALLKSGEQFNIYAPKNSQIKNILVKNNQKVQEGELMFVLESPELESEINSLKVEIASLSHQLKFKNVAPQWLKQSRVLIQELLAAESNMQGLLQTRENLLIRAPFSGHVVDLDTNLKPGNWVNTDHKIAILVNKKSPLIEAYVREKDVKQIPENAKSFFREEVSQKKYKTVIKEIDLSNTANLTNEYLASVLGGAIAVSKDEQGKLVPNESVYKILLSPAKNETNNAPLPQTARGQVVIEGERRSLIVHAWIKIVSVLVRESGF